MPGRNRDPESGADCGIGRGREVQEGGDKEWPIIITLSKREQMQFRMLLGRTAIKGKYVVDPSRSFCCKLI